MDSFACSFDPQHETRSTIFMYMLPLYYKVRREYFNKKDSTSFRSFLMFKWVLLPKWHYESSDVLACSHAFRSEDKLIVNFHLWIMLFIFWNIDFVFCLIESRRKKSWIFTLWYFLSKKQFLITLFFIFNMFFFNFNFKWFKIQFHNVKRMFVWKF